MSDRPALPPGVTVLERGWLSSNNVLICGGASCALVDSGYATHAPQTLALVQAALGGRSLDVLVNTHCPTPPLGSSANSLAFAPPCKRVPSLFWAICAGRFTRHPGTTPIRWCCLNPNHGCCCLQTRYGKTVLAWFS